MSFRDGQRRYGHVPPVQYPVAGQQHQQEDGNALGRRPSFNNGDDNAYYSHPQGHADAGRYGNGEDELFLQNPPARQPAYGSTGNALSGYQHQYHDATPPTPQHSTYNPQSFAQQPSSGFQRTQSTTLPYRQQQPSPQYPNQRTSFAPSPTNYTPQAYNPAAYASATSPQRHPTYHGYGSPDPSYGGAAAASHPSPSYGHSPGSTSSPAFQQPPQAPSYHPAYPASPSIQGFSPQTPTATYDPAQFAGAQFANGAGAGQQYSQAPYPTTSHMPAGPYGNDRNSMYNRDSRSNSQTSPLASPPMQPQQSPGLQRHPTNAPLPRRPVERETRYDHGQDHYGNQDQARLMQDIEAELGAIGPRNSQRTTTMPANGQNSNRYPDDQDQMRRYNSTATTLAHTASAASRPGGASAFDDDDDDPEGTAGVLAMQQAEMDDRRFSGTTFVYDAPPSRADQLPPPPEEQDRSSSGSEIGGMVDLSMLGGGYAGNLTYGNNVGSPPSQQSDISRPLPSPNYFNASYDKRGVSPDYREAHMDYGGTGGLQSPSAARLSFDEGDERVSLHSRQSGQPSPSKNDYEDLFYHPGHSSRPLPTVPPGTGSDSSSMLSVNTNRGQLQHTYSNSTDSRYYAHENPETIQGTQSPASLHPERSISLVGHSNTPQVYAPARSRTDAAEERKKANRHHQVSPAGPPLSEYDSTSGTVGAFDGITLPTGRKRRFVPNKLSTGDFRRCTEPWALSGVERWVRDMADGEVDLREKTIEEALILLFTFKVRTMNVADAEVLSNRVVAQMLQSGTIIPDEEWVKFGSGHISGVFWQLTGAGCYSPKVHDEEISGRCYSYHCTRTIKKVDLEGLDPDSVKPIDWNVFYGLTKEDLEGREGREIKRQNNLHEIVTGEEKYIKQLDFFRTVYRDDLRGRNPPLLKPDRQDKFLNAVFGKLESVMSINKDNLLAQLKYRQHEQGPWINGFSDIFREWIRKAKAEYIEYASGYPRARYMIEKEAERNVLFKRFLDDKQRHKSSEKLGWTHFLIAPVTRLQRYPLLLAEVEKNSDASSEELINLQKAIAEVKAVALECDIKVAETNKRVEMMELDRMLVLRPGFQSILNLDHLGRQLIMQGELTRLGSKGVHWVNVHALLFDHYLILAKAVASRDGRDKKYDVSKEPVPMPLLFLESTNDEPIQRQKGITTTLARTTTASTSNTQLSKVGTGSSGQPGIQHANTSSSLNTLTQTGSNDDSNRILYPFRVKHLGHEVYVLYATSARDRFEWCNRIIDAKTNHAKALHQQNAEPFRLRVLADAGFHYDGSSIYARTASVPVEGTPLDRAIKDIESVLGSAQGTAPVCRAQVNCATGFSAFGKSIIAIGTDYGVFISDPSNPRGWTRTIQASRVTQIAVLEEFSVCLIISDRSLVSYPLDVVAPVSEFAPPINDNPRRAPQRLAKDVTYFSTARMKERTLIFYKRKEGLHTTFKVLEPIYHKATEKRRLFGGRKGAPGSTESFRDFDEFFFPTECYSLSIFQTYIAVATSKGLEMLTLDKKQPMSIPDLKAPAIANIASRIRDQKPLGMFRLNENEFICTYEDCAVYVDKHGDVSRTLIMEYTGKQKKARGATMYGQYLLLFNEDYVEIRNADNGRLRQIIAGRDVRVLDYGIRGPTGGNAAAGQSKEGRNGQLTNVGDASKGTVKISMCHPELPGRQIVLEMLLNEGHVDAN